MNKEKIRNLQVIKDSTGKITRVGFYFGMGHFLEVRVDEKGKIIFCLGETHHGIEIDASEQVLADLIFELRDNPFTEARMPFLGKAVQQARLSGGTTQEVPESFHTTIK